MVFSELRKVLSNKYFITISIILMVINCIVFYSFCMENMNGKIQYSPESYREIMRDISDLSDDEIEEFLSKKYELCYSTQEEDVAYPYTGDRAKERLLISEVYDNYRDCVGYNELVNDKLEQLSRYYSIGATSMLNDYQKKSLDAKLSKYQILKDVNPQFGLSKGIEKIEAYKACDIMIICFIIVVIFFTFTYERDNQMLSLYKSTTNGRNRLIMSKLAACMIHVIAALIIFNIPIWIMGNALFGIGDMQRAIQSVNGFQFVVYDMSIMQYMMMLYGIKLLLYIAIVAVVFLVAVCSKSALKMYGILVALFGCSILMYAKIPENSYFSVLKSINMITPVFIPERIRSYHNINLMGTPCGTINTICVVVPIVICVFIYIVWAYFSEQKEAECNWLLRKIKHKNAISIRIRSLFGNECYKVFWLGKVFGIILLYLLFVRLTYKPIGEQFYINNDTYQRYYIDKLNGDITDEKIKYLKNENKRYSDIQEEIELLSDIESDIVKYQLLTSKMEGYNTFEKIYYETYPYLEKVDGQFLDTRGYELLTGSLQSKSKDIVLAIVNVLVLIFPLAFLFTNDYQVGIGGLINSTSNGRKRRSFYVLIIGSAILISTFLITYYPYYRAVISEFGFADSSYKARSLMHLENVPDSFSVAGYIVFINVLRLCGLFIVMMLTKVLAKKIRNVMTVIMILAILIVIPLVFAYFDMPYAKYFGINSLLLGRIFI